MPIQIIDRQTKRERTCRVLLVQLRTLFDSYFEERDGLLFPRDTGRITKRVESFLRIADKQSAHAVVFPELSLPPEALDTCKRWSKRNDGVVIAGSHYRATDHGYVPSAPIVFSDAVYFTEKLVSSPLETTVLARAPGAQAGTCVYSFTNTRIGNFAVLICSDYLDGELRTSILRGGLDILFVISLQRDSTEYHQRMNSDCGEVRAGLYIVYSNHLSPPHADGRSAIFGIVHKDYAAQLVRNRLSDGVPACKLIEMPAQGSYIVCELDLDTKRPTLPKTVHARSNVVLHDQDWEYNAKQREYKRKRGTDLRYRMVCFDLDGSLIRGEKFGWTFLWKYLGEQGRVEPELQKVYMKQYLSQRFLSGKERIQAYQRWCDDAVAEFVKAKLNKADFREIARRASLTKNFFEALQVIRRERIKTYIVSGGVDRLMYEVAPNIQSVMDGIYINRLLVSGPEENVSGVIATHYDFEGKLTLVEELCYEHDIELDQVVFVADAFNDEMVVTKVGKAIAYSASPDGPIEISADVVIKEDDLTLLLEHIIVKP